MTWRRRTGNFLFPIESDRWLTLLRIGLGLVIVLYAGMLRADWNGLFGETSQGLIDRRIFETLLSMQSPVIPRLGWVIWIGKQMGLSERFALSFTWIALLGAGFFLILGLFARPAAFLAWFLQLAASKSEGLLSYGADNLITIGLFYLMIAPLPDRCSADRVMGRWREPDPSQLGFHRRLLQLHLCLIYLFGGLTKCLGKGWWDGSNIWRALTIPPFDVLPMEVVASWRPILPLLGISVCLLEISYAFLIWPRRSRQVVLWAVCVMHGAIGLMMGMFLFAVIMIALNLAAFSTTENQASMSPRSAG